VSESDPHVRILSAGLEAEMTETRLSVQPKTAPPPSLTMLSGGLLQRTSGSAELADACEGCGTQGLSLQRSTRNSEPETQNSGGVPPIVDEVLRSPGRPLDPDTRAFMEPRFGHDFSRVRVHTDGRAEESARAVNALAYTVGRDIVLGSAHSGLGHSIQRHVMAHELAHVVQQSAVSHAEQPETLAVGAGDDIYEQDAERVAGQISGATKVPATGPVSQRVARRRLSRVNTAEATRVLRTGTVAGSGLQFYPMQLASTRIGPVSGVGGLIGDTSSNRLSVIIGQNLTLNQLATILLPLWQTATPFTPPGATAPVTPQAITAADLARGLLVYNQYYLPVPALTRWKAGLRFPLPIDIDATTNEGVLHPNLIASLASTFDAAWEPLLIQPAIAPTAPAPADLGAAVTTFLASETSPSGRGIMLATRAITNAHEDSAFILEAFRQLGAAAFDVALEFMNHSVNHQIGLLASERDGASILGRIRTVLAAPPATLTQDQQASLTRALGMLGAVAGVAARETPVYQPAPVVLATSAAGVQFVADWEQFRPNLYNDQANHCTIGYGTLVHSGPCNGSESAEFIAGITEPRARELLTTRIDAAAAVVNAAVTVALTQNQFDALVSFAYNVGHGAFRGSTLLTELNAGNYAEVPGQINRWTRAGGAVSAGLVTRRQREGDMFRDGTYNSAH
jgi:GH24 family phage-related lysozyme (muramidase)